MSITKLRAFGILGSMIAVAVALTGIFAGSSPAAQKAAPAAGVGCVAKISGRGATFATNAFRIFARGFRDDICGAVGSGDASFDGNTMVAYNWTGALTGSGAGITNTKCRGDAFGASDVPVFQADLAQMNGPLLAPGSTTCAGIQGLTPPFQPNAAPFPAAADLGNKNVMVFPVAGSSEGVGINLTAVECGVNPSNLQFTMEEVSKIWGGDIKQWNDPALRAGGRNASLANCAVNIVRVPRFDRSGTTQVFKNALNKGAHNARAGATCVPANNWTFYAQDAQNQAWPDSATSPDAQCSDVSPATTNGTGPQILKCSQTPGAVCYADISDFQTAPGNTLKRPNLQNALGTQFVSPTSGLRANCNFSSVTNPGSGANGWVNQDPTDTWAVDNPAGNRGDVGFLGSAYPICGLTFGLVYTGMNNAAVANPISRLSADQRRTMYAFFSYALSSLGQDRLNTGFYSSLPSTAVSTIRAGFQSNY